MADSAPRRQPASNAPAVFSTPPVEPLKKHPWQLISASVFLAVWIIFLAAMAAYNH